MLVSSEVHLSMHFITFGFTSLDLTPFCTATHRVKKFFDTVHNRKGELFAVSWCESIMILNLITSIDTEAVYGSYNLTISACSGRWARIYAAENGIPLEIIVGQQPAFVLGDITGDGKVNMRDVAEIRKLIAG